MTPGPKAPKDLDSFIAPFLDELKLLQDGVPAYNAHTNSQFLLKAHIFRIDNKKIFLIILILI